MLGAWTAAATRRPATWLAALFIATAILGSGIARLETDVDLLDILPDDDPNTDAARRLQEEFGAAYTLHVNMDVRIDAARCAADSALRIPERQTEQRCGNITDEVYVRAMDEVQEFFLTHPDTPFEYVIGAHSFFRLLNWTAEGGVDAPPGAFALPPRDAAGETRYRLLEETGFRTVPESILLPMGHGGVSYNIAFIPKDGLSSQDVGHGAIAILQDYVAAVDAGETTWTVFGSDNAPTYYTELAIADAHSADLLGKDLRVLGPAMLAFLFLALYASYRSLRGTIIAASSIVLSGFWVFGAMGWLGVPFGTFTLAVAPLLLGVGIDMAIHLVTDLQYHLHRGDALSAAARQAARRAGYAMLIATGTTVTGLLVLAMAPSPLIRELGLVAALAITSVFVVALIFVPAATACFGNQISMGRAFRPSRNLPRFAKLVDRHPMPFAAGLIVLVAAGSLASLTIVPEPFGEFALNYPEGDPYRENHLDNLQTFYNTEPGDPLFIGNALVVQGDMLDPQVHHYIRDVAAELAVADHVAPGTVTHLPFIVDQYDAVRGGIPSATTVIGQDTLLPIIGMEREKPDSRDEIKDVLDEMFASPMAHFAALFADTDYEISLITLSTQTGDIEGVRDSWNSVWAAVERAGPAPPGTSIAFVGTTPTNYLFVEEQLPFVAWLTVASFGAVAVLVFAGTRDVRAAATAAGLMVATTGIWAGVLWILGFGWSIYLVVPLVFISAIGSDYVVHALLGLRNASLEDTYAVVGKAILFGALTDAGAFAIFAFASDLAVRQTLVAATFAVAVAFGVALTGVVLLQRRQESRGATAPLRP